MALPEDRKGSVQITAVGLPSFSMMMPSSTLPELQEPQSPIPAITTWHCSASILAWSAGMPWDTEGLRR